MTSRERPTGCPPPTSDGVASALLERATELRRLAGSILARSAELVEIAERLRGAAPAPARRARTG